MKPLTIEELKALEVGDWVWFVDKSSKKSEYVKLSWGFRSITCHVEVIDVSHTYKDFAYSDYDKTWLAYKNKESAEAKGEILELPCIRKVVNKIGTLYEVVYVQISGTIGTETYPYEEQAERRLAGLKGV